MKYVAILDSDDELSEDTINGLKETVFVGDEKTPYCFEFTSIKEEPKTLEQEPCEDIMTIHTQGLDEGIRCAMCTNSMKSDRGCDGGCVVNEAMYKEVMNTIRNHIVPPITPTRKKDVWIPCSERLPEPKETENLIAKYYLVQNEYGDMMVARWDGNGWEQMYQHEYLEDDVIAWTSLPEEYKTDMERKE